MSPANHPIPGVFGGGSCVKVVWGDTCLVVTMMEYPFPIFDSIPMKQIRNVGRVYLFTTNKNNWPSALHRGSTARVKNATSFCVRRSDSRKKFLFECQPNLFGFHLKLFGKMLGSDTQLVPANATKLMFGRTSVLQFKGKSRGAYLRATSNRGPNRVSAGAQSADPQPALAIRLHELPKPGSRRPKGDSAGIDARHCAVDFFIGSMPAQGFSQIFSCARLNTRGLIAFEMKQLQRQRESMGLLPEDVAKRSGVHVRTIKDLEAGQERKVQSRVQKGLAKALGVKPIALFTSEGFAR